MKNGFDYPFIINAGPKGPAVAAIAAKTRGRAAFIDDLAEVIKAALAGSARTATRSVPGGPGPSIIDLPAPGCWTLHLSWSGHTDQLKLRYVA